MTHMSLGESTYTVAARSSSSSSSSSVTGYHLLPTPAGVVPFGAPPEFRGQINPRQFRTRLCKFYQEGLVCPYEADCAYAHGVEQLRTPQQNEEEGVVVNIIAPTRSAKQLYTSTTTTAAVTSTCTSAVYAPPAFVPAVPQQQQQQQQPARLKDMQECSSYMALELSVAATSTIAADHPPMPSYKLKKLLREQQLKLAQQQQQEKEKEEKVVEEVQHNNDDATAEAKMVPATCQQRDLQSDKQSQSQSSSSTTPSVRFYTHNPYAM
jgi:hypothetical protein